MPREILTETGSKQLDDEDRRLLEDVQHTRETTWRQHLEQYPQDGGWLRPAQNPDELRRWLSLKEKQYDLAVRCPNALRRLSVLLGDSVTQENYFGQIDQLNTALSAINLPDEVQEDPDIANAMVQLSNFVKQNRAQPGDRPQDNAPSQMDFAQLQAAVLPGLQNLRNYFEGQQNRSLTEDEQADLDRLDDQYLGLHLTPDSTDTELFEYQRAQDQLQSQRAVRYRELNDLSNSLLERISRKNLSDPDSVRSSIHRINRIYSVLGLSQEDIRSYVEAQSPQTANRLSRQLDFADSPDQWGIRRYENPRAIEKGLENYINLLTSAALYKDGYMDCLKTDFIDQRIQAQAGLRDTMKRLDILSPQEAGLLTGQDYSLAHREQMKQDAFSQISQVTDSVWEEFAKNRGIKTLGRP